MSTLTSISERELAAIDSSVLGAAAEHYVMCQLLRRGMIAALAPVGVPDADIIVSDRVGNVLSAVQVKARRDLGSDRGWHMKQKHENIIRDLLFYCFVDFGRSLADAPKCWIIPSTTVARAVRTSHEIWLSTPGKNGRKHNDSVMRRLLPHYPLLASDPTLSEGWMDQYFEGWRLIGRPMFI